MRLINYPPIDTIYCLEDELKRVFNTSNNFKWKVNKYPLVELRKKDNHIYVIAELAGLTKEEIDIQIKDNVIEISGSKKGPEDALHYSEIIYGKFSRVITLPNKVDSSNVKAEYINGVLTITLPIREEDKTLKINVD